MQGYILKISYKGTAYCGWQVQPEKPTVQSVLQAAVEATFGVKVDITGCSRTDSGVHAKEFVALVSGQGLPDIPVVSLPLAINTKLPEDIAVIEASVAPDDFHPRYSAKGKEYIYVVHNSRLRDPFVADISWQFPRNIDVLVADELCKEFVGKYDFTAFMASGSKIIDAVREVKYFNAVRQGDNVIFTVAADGFLYNMVRIMVGTVVEAASGTKTLSIKEIINSRNRANAGITAPAKGLTLNRVFY